MKVTKEQVLANMKDVEVQTIYIFNKPITQVHVRMLNGFVITEQSTCIDPLNYSEDIGKEICLKKIEDKIWELLGFLFIENSFNEIVSKIITVFNKKWLIEKSEKIDDNNECDFEKNM